MADMADVDEVEECWEALAGVIDVERVVPITYVNSSAAVKAFVGRHGGACCTSSNARGVLTWALERGDRVLFVPDQHLGRNTALALGYPPSETAVWNPRLEQGGLEDREIKDARFLLWRATARSTSASRRPTWPPPGPSTPVSR
jgi:quinolinate synthase